MGLRMPGRGRRDDQRQTPAERAASRSRRAEARKADADAGDPEGGARRRVARAGGPLVAGLGEIAAIGREMLAIPAAMALGLAERLGLVILAAWRALRPLLLAALALALRLEAAAARALTPSRALAAVALVAAILLGISQFLDYREVRAGVEAYAEVERVAPAPQVPGSASTAGSAHAYVLLAVALASAILVVLALAGRWRLARVLVPLGLVVVAVATFVDAPKGLDEGLVAVQFEGAEARLLGPFWVQVASGAVIAVCGLLLALVLRSGVAAGGRRPRAGRARTALGGAPPQGAQS